MGYEKLVEVEKPKFPFELKREVVDGKLVISPTPKEWTPEQKVQASGYFKKQRKYKKFKVAGKTINRLIDKITRQETKITEQKAKISELRDRIRELKPQPNDEAKKQRKLERALKKEEKAKKLIEEAKELKD